MAGIPSHGSQHRSGLLQSQSTLLLPLPLIKTPSCRYPSPPPPRRLNYNLATSNIATASKLLSIVIAEGTCYYSGTHILRSRTPNWITNKESSLHVLNRFITWRQTYWSLFGMAEYSTPEHRSIIHTGSSTNWLLQRVPLETDIQPHKAASYHYNTSSENFQFFSP